MDADEGCDGCDSARFLDVLFDDGSRVAHVP